MTTVDPAKLSDEELIRLAAAEREAGVPDIQIAAAAHDAERRLDSGDTDEAAAHPS